MWVDYRPEEQHKMWSMGEAMASVKSFHSGPFHLQWDKGISLLISRWVAWQWRWMLAPIYTLFMIVFCFRATRSPEQGFNHSQKKLAYQVKQRIEFQFYAVHWIVSFALMVSSTLTEHCVSWRSVCVLLCSLSIRQDTWRLALSELDHMLQLEGAACQLLLRVWPHRTQVSGWHEQQPAIGSKSGRTISSASALELFMK
jgi:hypothetical protein